MFPICLNEGFYRRCTQHFRKAPDLTSTTDEGWKTGWGDFMAMKLTHLSSFLLLMDTWFYIWQGSNKSWGLISSSPQTQEMLTLVIPDAPRIRAEEELEPVQLFCGVFSFSLPVTQFIQRLPGQCEPQYCLTAPPHFLPCLITIPASLVSPPHVPPPHCLVGADDLRITRMRLYSLHYRKLYTHTSKHCTHLQMLS